MVAIIKPDRHRFGELAEWSKASVLKTDRPSGFRGFESHTPRRNLNRRR